VGKFRLVPTWPHKLLGEGLISKGIGSVRRNQIGNLPLTIAGPTKNKLHANMSIFSPSYPQYLIVAFISTLIVTNMCTNSAIGVETRVLCLK
jgi:hypothetical protein